MSRRALSVRGMSLACALLVALTACGSSKAKSSSSSTTAAKAAVTTTEAPADSAADKAKADAINLKDGDLPAGWTSTPASTDTSTSASDKQLYDCAGISDPKTQTTADVSSPDFSMGEFSQASSEVQFVKSTDQAKKDLAALKNPKFAGCLKTAFDTQMKDQASGAGGTVGTSKVDQLPDPSGADGVSYRMTVPITAVGQTFTFYIDFVALLKGRAEVTLTGFNGNSPFPADLKQTLTTKLVQRLQANA